MLELNDRGIPHATTRLGEKVVLETSGLHFLTEQEIIDGDFDNDEKPVIGLTAGELERLAEIAVCVQGDVDVWRDWENLLVAYPNESWRELHELPCVLSIGTTGNVAHYDVNQPRNFDTLVELLIHHIGNLSAPDRDRSTIVFLQRALAAVQSAAKTMPNHVDSVFSGDDARRLSEIERQLCLLALSEQDISS